jgi:hypothetical protein
VRAVVVLFPFDPNTSSTQVSAAIIEGKPMVVKASSTV